MLRPLEVPSVLPLLATPADEASAPRRPLPPRPEVAPALESVSTGPVARGEPSVLRSGMVMTLRVCQVLPKDGLAWGNAC